MFNERCVDLQRNKNERVATAAATGVKLKESRGL